MSTEQKQIEQFIADDPYTFMWEGDNHEGFEVVAREEGDDRRWSKMVYIVIKAPSGKYFRWNYDQGLTEYQPNDYESGTVEEVERVEKTVIVLEWKKVQ